MSATDDDTSDDGRAFNTYRDGKVHVLSEKCATCIFRPKERFVDGRVVADLVRATKDEPGATVVCHATLQQPVQENAICRGWYDRFSETDPVLQLAGNMGVIKEVPVPPKAL